MSDADYGPRIANVEGEVRSLHQAVGAISTDLTGVKADVKGLGSILSRIEQGVLRSQEQAEHREQLSKPNVTAMISILITMISIIVGGAWIIGGSLSRQDERSEWVKSQLERQESRIWDERNRIRPPTSVQGPVAETREIGQTRPSE